MIQQRPNDSVVGFHAAEHSYFIPAGGRFSPVPGVSSIIQPFIGTDFSMIDPALLEAASVLGRRVHRMIQVDSTMGLERSDVDDDLLCYFDTWRDFRDRSGFKPLLSEARVLSVKHGYAGTLDLFGELNGELWLPDVKRVARVSRTAAIQTAAYKQALVETYPELEGKTIRRGVLHMKKGGGFKLVPCANDSDFRVFLSCLNIHNFQRSAA